MRPAGARGRLVLVCALIVAGCGSAADLGRAPDPGSPVTISQSGTVVRSIRVTDAERLPYARRASTLPRRPRRPRRPRLRTITLPAGRTVGRLAVREGAGAVRLLRVTVRRGTRARVVGVIAGVAGVSISSPGQARDPSETCRRDRRDEVCTQAVEACPLPAATWQFTVHKRAGPAGELRLDFIVARRPLERAPAAPASRLGVWARAAGAVNVGPGTVALLYADGSLWVAGHGHVTRLDPETGRVQARIQVPADTVGSAQLASGAGSVWAAYTGPSTLLRIDPRTDRLVARIGLGGLSDGGGVAFSDGLVWVSEDTSTQH
ncbi:MAG: hypothetical protein ACRDMJ_16555, partial [Solirubrobacteraceae bacterium]